MLFFSISSLFWQFGLFMGACFLLRVYFFYLFKSKEVWRECSNVLCLLQDCKAGFVDSNVWNNRRLAHAGVYLTQVPYWNLVLGTPSLKNLLLIPIKFSVGRISFYPKIIYYTVAGLWTLFTFSFVILGAIKKRYLFFIFLFPLLLAFLFSFFSPLIQYFRFLYLLPVISLLMVAGVDQYISVKERKGFLSLFWKKHEEKLLDKIRNNAVFEILLAFFILFSLLYLLLPAYHREDWKRMSQVLPANSPIYLILPSSDPLLYYRPEITLKELRTIGDTEFLRKDTYVVPYTSPIYGFDYENTLRNKGCRFKERYTFREVYFEKWNCGFISSSDTHRQQG